MEMNLEKEASAVVTDYSQLRYNILYRINRMHLRRRAAIRKAVCNNGTSQTSYYVFLNLKKDDKRDMDARVLRAFAKALNIDMELLFND